MGLDILKWYLIAMNLLTFVLFAADKYKAVHKRWRIREAVLLGASMLGGSVGGMLAMWMLRHKIRSPKFFVGVPLMFILQVALLLYFLVLK